MAHFLGQMEGNTKETILMIRKKDKVLSIGRMVENMKVAGKTANNMATASTHLPVAKSNKEDGMKARDSIGSARARMEPLLVKQVCESQLKIDEHLNIFQYFYTLLSRKK